VYIELNYVSTKETIFSAFNQSLYTVAVSTESLEESLAESGYAIAVKGGVHRLFFKYVFSIFDVTEPLRPTTRKQRDEKDKKRPYAQAFPFFYGLDR
jgi:hypothetical protein